MEFTGPDRLNLSCERENSWAWGEDLGKQEDFMNSDQIWFAGSIIVLSAIAVVQVRKQLKRRRARAWPKAPGQVVSAVLRLQERGEGQSVWLATVNYQYEAQQQTHGGFLQRSYMLKGHADKWAERFAAGRALIVR